MGYTSHIEASKTAKDKKLVSIEKRNFLPVVVYETSASGNCLKRRQEFNTSELYSTIRLLPKKTFQKITGFGGSFTASSAFLLNQMSKQQRQKIIAAYFSKEGARYSLTRTHINSCDFSLNNYSYAPVANDLELENFSIEEDKEGIIPFIKEAMNVSKEGFKIISSPWTAPPWMKDNKAYVGGKLLSDYYEVWAKFFAKYIDAYQNEGIPIWGITVENEPLGNGNNWESMHFSAQEMTYFVQNYLGPILDKEGKREVKILGYDQNREHLKHWVDVMFHDSSSSEYFDGTAIHWYASTYEVFPNALQYAHQKAPNKYLIQTEACIDAEVPHWKDDEWYWSKEATDWGWDWAPEEQKSLHPKYVPVFRYARDIIGCLNNWVDGWIDWNMVLDRNGGPNWAKNWCVAPILVDPVEDEIYFTPLYYTMAHFSKYIRPGAYRIDFKNSDESLRVTAAKNSDGSIVAVVLNMDEEVKYFELVLDEFRHRIDISGKAIQTLIIN